MTDLSQCTEGVDAVWGDDLHTAATRSTFVNLLPPPPPMRAATAMIFGRSVERECRPEVDRFDVDRG
jgi:hypothetical protein